MDRPKLIAMIFPASLVMVSFCVGCAHHHRWGNGGGACPPPQHLAPGIGAPQGSGGGGVPTYQPTPYAPQPTPSGSGMF